VHRNQTNDNNRQTRTRRTKSPSSIALLTTAALAILVILLVTIGLPPLHADTASKYNDVQLFAQTSGSLTYNSFEFTAYNQTGSTVAAYQGPYPAAAFELPSGTYIFTASATAQGQQAGIKCYPMVAQGKDVNGAGGVASSRYVPPYCGGYQATEYGYSEQQVSGPTVLNVTTQNLTAIPPSTITVHVSYANGTAASGASVSANLLGASSFYYMGAAGQQVMYGTTDSNGAATLTAPAGPLQVTAWAWVPVNLPTSQTTVQTTIGGEKVNVTVYWQPTSIGLAGDALIIPPTTSASITLHAQTPSYWATPYGAATGTAVSSSGAVGPSPPPAAGAIPAKVAQQYQSIQGYSETATISAPTRTVTATPAEVTTTPTPQPATSAVSSTVLIAVAAAALVTSALSLSLVALRTRNHV